MSTIEHDAILDLRTLGELYDELIAREDSEDEPLDEDEREALAALRELMDELGTADLARWGNAYDPTLIADWYFEDYARELAEDIGAIDPDASWPLTYIDWKAAADALRIDYTSVTFDGHDYLIRA